MNGSWKTYVTDMCSDAWGLGPRRTQRVIEEIEVLIATDQLSEFAVAGVLFGVGVTNPIAGVAAQSIRATIGDTRA